ncbi:MAG: hypothetical protein CVU18_17985 [Betaproteobacteria bacterium HGW-Betaproteobacteria-12]|nr:MAG: hypothetical protein CVU18_17985 [Betaproteobacteria bacterium HGW-Betaproteobacteria-12]
MGLGLPVAADIRLTMGPWEDAPPCTGRARNMDEVAEIQQGRRPRPVCRKGESEKLDDAAIAEAQRLAATSSKFSIDSPGLGYQLYFDDRKYYLQPMRFMAKDRPDEVCKPTHGKGPLSYRCEEGQTYKHSCHLMFFNTRYELVGVHRIRTDEPFPIWCNALPATGVANKTKNELLVTFQYFPTDRKVASKISDVGSGWIRMTSLFRLVEENGRISIEQDDSCLKNPNRIESIPDARAILKRCAQPK